MKKPQKFLQALSIMLFSFVFLLNLTSNAQDNAGKPLDSLNAKKLNWYNLDPETDKIQGVSVEKVYNELVKTSQAKKKIVVAVIDGGVDIHHEDLEGKIWHNKGEMPKNGIDDDKNGFIDDVHGWNFIGNSKGDNLNGENYEFVRIVRKHDEEFRDVKSDVDVPADKKEVYKLYTECKLRYTKEYKESVQERDGIKDFLSKIDVSEKKLKKFLDKENLTKEDVENIKPAAADIYQAKMFMMHCYENNLSKKMLERIKDHYVEILEKHLKLDLDGRKIIGDNPDDINDRSYGNPDVKGPRAEHGTFVAGIIAANRSNAIGIDGIADNVEIMVLRVVPDGDEYDKDIALAIRYAVDNGANIINMSFGKDFSPNKIFIDEAIVYAEKHNVLLIHASGNSSDNVDESIRFPTNILEDKSRLKSWITVGATDSENNMDFVGVFSNYGNKNVDIFAPGVDVISLYPESTYNLASGTSFSCPVVSGVAALVWSYYPSLTALELKDVIMNSYVDYNKLKVYCPNPKRADKKKIKFGKLSVSGGLINAYKAMKLAEKKTRQ